MGLITIQGKYLAFVMLAIELVVSGMNSMLTSLTGVMAGYAWYFGRDAPRMSRRRPDLAWLAWFARYMSPFFQTPRMFRQLMDGKLLLSRMSHSTRSASRRPANTTAASTGSRGVDRAAILAATEARMHAQKSQ